MEAAQVVLGFGRAPDLRLGDDLDQWHAAAIEVHQAHVVETAAAGPFVQEFAGILLEVEAMDADRAWVIGERQAAALGERTIELAYLVALRQIGIEVILAREHGGGGELTVEGEGQGRREIDRSTVQDRQGPGIAETDGTDQGVGIGAETILAAAEDLAAGFQMDMNFQPDDRLPRRHCASVSQRLNVTRMNS